MAETKKTPLDGNFYKRADTHINLANSHINEQVSPADANNSFMFAASRFNTWITAAGFNNGEEMAKEKEEIINFFASQYKHMLEQNFDNYVENFEQFINDVKKHAEKK